MQHSIECSQKSINETSVSYAIAYTVHQVLRCENAFLFFLTIFTKPAIISAIIIN